MQVEIIDKIENFNIEDFLQLETIVNDRLWSRTNYMEDALDKYETDEEGKINSATFMEYFNTNQYILDAVIYVKNPDNKVIAGCCLQSWSFDRVKLVDFVVSSEYEGRGVGSLMLENVIDYCKKSGYVEINLEVREYTPAIKLYEKFNFEFIRLEEAGLS